MLCCVFAFLLNTPIVLFHSVQCGYSCSDKTTAPWFSRSPHRDVGRKPERMTFGLAELSVTLRGL